MTSPARWSFFALLALVTPFGAAGCVSVSTARLRASATSVVTRALRSTDADERLRATRIATHIADPELGRSLPALLEDDDLRVQAAAAVALVTRSPIDVRESASRVLARVFQGNEPGARLIAFDGLRALSDSLGLLRKLTTDPDPALRARVATELGTWRPSGSGAALFAEGVLKALAADPDPSVRAGALRACGSYPTLLKIVEVGLADRALGVQLAALAALERLDDSLGRYTALASSDQRFLTLRAAVRLRRLGHDGPALDAVRAALADHRPEVRVAAMNAAGELGAAAAALAVPLLRDPDPAVRLAAARALIHDGAAAQALPALRIALGGPLALEAADELARLGDAKGRAVLDAEFASAEPARRRLALALLSPLPGAGTLFERALVDADAEVRLSAAETVLRRFYR